MIKVKTTMILIKEYPINPEHYPEGSTVEQMMNLDLESFKDDVLLFLDMQSEGSMEVKSEVLHND